MNPYLWQMRPYFRRVAGLLAIGSVAGIVMNTTVVLPAILLGRAIDTARAFGSGHASASAVGWAAAAFVAGTLVTEIPRIIKRYWLAVVCARIRSDIRGSALRGVFAWPMERLHQTPVGDLMARIIGDVEVLNTGVREFTIETWDTILFSCSFVVAMLFYDAGLTLLVLAPVPVALLLALAAGRLVSRRTTLAREANADMTSLLQEQLAGIRVLRLFGRAAAAVERFATLSQGQRQANLATTRLRLGLQPVYGTLMTAGVVLLVWKGGERVIAGGMTVGALVAYLQLYTRFITRAPRIPQMVNAIQSGGAAYARLRPLLAPLPLLAAEPRLSSFRFGHVAGVGPTTGIGCRVSGALRRAQDERGSYSPLMVSLSNPPKADELVEPPPTPHTLAIAVSVEDVTFRYPGTETAALRQVSLDVPAGAFVAVTGPVGSGKSALARALLGLYPLVAGRVRLDGRPVEEMSADERAGLIGYLPQDPHLFSGSIRDNVLLGADQAVGSGQWAVGLGSVGARHAVPAPEQEPGAWPSPSPRLSPWFDRFAKRQREKALASNTRHPTPDSRRRPDTRREADAALEQILGLAALEVDLRAFPAGLETEIGELGVRVSGGQRQRIALARALAAALPRTPGLLVLDDPFSAVDVDTEASIVSALREAFGPLAPPERQATILLCSHRLAAFPQADLVVVLDGGLIEEQGTHAGLVAQNGLYARIYRAQRRTEQSGQVEGAIA